MRRTSPRGFEPRCYTQPVATRPDSTIATVALSVVAGCNGKQATITGTGAANKLAGTSGNDVIAGLGGGDTILSRCEAIKGVP
jgi:hypothetical protein